MDVETFLQEIRQHEAYKGQIVHVERLPERAAQYAELSEPLPPRLAEALARQGITALYTHQVAAIEAARAGKDVVVVTGTASGKTLCYNVPVLESILRDRRSRALYLFPLKALAQDQARKLADLDLFPEVRAATYDGDTPESERRAVRSLAGIVLTNPDMLHLGILPYHTLWAEFFFHLRYVVIDEVHTYRGVFGSHTANILKRLHRICEHYGSRPQFICCSATIANPAELTRTLTGREMEVIDSNGAPRGAKTFVIWNPPLQERRTGLRRSPNIEATFLLSQLVQRGVRTLTFTVARSTAELLLRYVRGALAAEAPELGEKVMSYRAGYLASDRRNIERQLFEGELLGVVSTVALEMGIDIGGLDACILTGFPGTIASTWQQAGRAGRGREESLAILVSLLNPVDQFFAKHPQRLFTASTEHALLDPDNIYILGGHVLCAAYELPLEAKDWDRFGPALDRLLPIFAEEGLLTQRGDWYWSGEGYPAAQLNIRSASGDAFQLLDVSRGGKLIGTMEQMRVFETLHEGAIYLHAGETYRVDQLNQQRKEVRLKPVQVNYYTLPAIWTDVTVNETVFQQPLGPLTAAFGDVTVTRQVTGYRELQHFTEEVLATKELNLPPNSFETMGLWLTLPADLSQQVRDRGCHLLGGVHALEHALTAVVPLYAMCDRLDVAGASTAKHPGLGGPAVFLYDTYPGGVGICEKGYELLVDVMQATYDAIAHCECEFGCPSCIQAPFCGSNNEPLDKEAALLILRAALGMAVVTG